MKIEPDRPGWAVRPGNGLAFMAGMGIYRTTVLDVRGAEVATGPPFRGWTELDLSGLEPGVYLVELRSEQSGRRILQRLVRI